MRIGEFANILAMLFTDEMDINRYAAVTAADDTTENQLPDTPKYSNVNCKFSFMSSENPEDSKVDDNPVKSIAKVFCKLDVDVQAGDFITVRRRDDNGILLATYSGRIGLPSVYITHKEFFFAIKESA